MKKHSVGKKIGYLGGGQLARMLCQSAQSLGLEAHCLSQSPTDPAAQVTSLWHQGSLDSSNDLKVFFQKLDVVTFESEFLDPDVVETALQGSSVEVYPNPQVMRSLRDRFLQKTELDRAKLPTAPWRNLTKLKDLLDFVEQQGLPLVCKKRLFGYDGYGTFILKTKTELNDFVNTHFQENTFIAESFIPFKRELAIIVARSQDGSFTHFPFVESRQHQARCDWVKGPIKNKHTQSVIKKLKVFLKNLNYVGVMGVEFFQSSSGKLMVNEVAPRVHNTGHYSLSTGTLSQFDLHNLCLLGYRLPKEIKVKRGFAMANLIGKGESVQLKAVSGLYWYGKSENRPGRKMGHINCVSSTANEALKGALKRRGEQRL